jgi:hypothetical protein
MAKTVNAGLEALKITLLVLITVALGFAVFFCITKVGNLNNRAAILQACIDNKDITVGCPSTPISKGQISSLHNEADTLGSLGWVCFIVDVFVVGGTVLDILTE